MRKLISAIILAVFLLGASLLLPSTASADGHNFTINSFHADINIQEDGSFVVSEKIEVTFHRSRHGIYREIPYKYENELGEMSRTPIDVLDVTDIAGERWEYQVRRKGSVINIRIGDPNVWVDDKQIYIITYRVEAGLLFFENHDELYWNVTGNYWESPIEQASATVNLISEKKSSQHLTGCYTGYYGRSESDCNLEVFDNGVRFETARSLRTGEGLTVAYGFDKGIVRGPTAMELFVAKYNLTENWVFVVPIIVLIFMLFQWSRKGRDPKVREAVTVMYEPPKIDGQELTAAEVGALVDEKFDPRDLTGAIIGLAVKGYVKIEEIKVEGIISMFDSIDHKLVNLKQPEDNVTRFEHQLYWHLFPAGEESIMVSDMKNKFYKHLSSLRETLWSDLKGKKYFSVSPPTVRASYVGVGIVIAVFGALASIWLAPDYTVRGVIAAALSGLIVIVFSNAMPAKTRIGARAHFHVLGFQEFMNRADKDRLERMGKDIFYKYMPYAIALDVVDHWSEAFEGLLDEPPNWYVSTAGFHTFSPTSFSRSLSAATTSLSTATFSAPRGSGTSGGGGGGSSGGGGGGGGGGSW